MKRFSTFTVIAAIAMIVSACGAEPPPTVNPADVQGTAQAAALTIVAQTQAAIPTQTPPPPTETATQVILPTITQLVPTQGVALASPTTAAPTSSGDPCDTRVLSGNEKGHETIIRIWNRTKGNVRISLYLNETEGHGECGYRSYDIAKNGDVVIRDLVTGCYNVWAWALTGENFRSSGYGCINNSDKWTFEVNTATVKFVGP